MTRQVETAVGKWSSDLLQALGIDVKQRKIIKLVLTLEAQDLARLEITEYATSEDGELTEDLTLVTRKLKLVEDDGN